MSGRTAALGVFVVAAATLLVAGCAAERTVPPGPTDAEVSQIVALQAASGWPGIQGAGRTVLDCMERYGFERAIETSEGIRFVPVAGTDGVLGSTYYLCTEQYPIRSDGSGYLSTAQLGYMYDYFTESLAPCLGLLGHAVGTPPTRGNFISTYYLRPAWLPYYDATPKIAPDEWHTVDFRCPPLPPQTFGYFH